MVRIKTDRQTFTVLNAKYNKILLVKADLLNFSRQADKLRGASSVSGKARYYSRLFFIIRKTL
jgi:hypothetical protein